ncbi:protein that induces appearance of [PIN+] prion when overproduced [Saitoella coloradoensis]
MSDQNVLYINRVLGGLHNDLSFLVDSGVITEQAYNSISAQIPRRWAAGAVVASPSNAIAVSAPPASSPQHQQSNITTLQDKFSNSLSLNPSQSQPPAPPVRGPAPIAHATALYAYPASDPGDLALQPGERVEVLEYVNGDWWKGRIARTQREGIFPSNYVQLQEKSMPPAPMPYQQQQVYAPTQPGPYNAPIPYQQQQVQQQQPQQQTVIVEPKKESMLHGVGKKFGNAAIFGAGATVGGNIVNSIF